MPQITQRRRKAEGEEGELPCRAMITLEDGIDMYCAFAVRVESPAAVPIRKSKSRSGDIPNDGELPMLNLDNRSLASFPIR